MTSLTLAIPAGPEQADAPCFAQRQSALNRANEVRSGIAQVKRELATGVLSFEAALEDERARRVMVGPLLLAVPHFGPIKVRELLDDLRIGGWRPVCELSQRQRRALCAALVPDRDLFDARTLAALRGSSCVTAADLTRDLDASHHMVAFALRRLEARGLAVRSRRGHAVSYWRASRTPTACVGRSERDEGCFTTSLVGLIGDE